jgi:hypothetical protein
MNIPNASVESFESAMKTFPLSNLSVKEGLEKLIQKLEPLLVGQRLSRIVDVLSVVVDVMDMTI